MCGLTKKVTPCLFDPARRDIDIFQQLFIARDEETRRNYLKSLSLNRVLIQSGLFYFNENQQYLQKPSMNIKRKQFSFVAIDK